MDKILLEKRGLLIAKEIDPYDTGFLVSRTTSKTTQNGFVIRLETDYVGFLEEGTRLSKKHVGFISRDIVGALTRLIIDTYNNSRSRESINYRSIGEKTKNTPARTEQFLRSKARGG